MSEPPKSVAAAPAFWNGEILAGDGARVSIADRGVLFGFGFFETFRTSGGRAHLWPLHCHRLEQACSIAGLELPPHLLVKDETRFANVMNSLLRHAGVSDAAFRYTVTAGSVDGSPSEFLTLRPLPSDPPSEGICLRVLNIRRDNGEWLPRPKSLNYLNALLGQRELATRTTNGTDEGLFLSRDGDLVVETSRQNIGWITDGRIFYPDLSIGALAGTGLAWLLGLEWAAQPSRSPLTELLRADAIFVINSIRGITSVRRIHDQNDRVIRDSIGSHVHPVVVSLRRQWQEALDANAGPSRARPMIAPE